MVADQCQYFLAHGHVQQMQAILAQFFFKKKICAKMAHGHVQQMQAILAQFPPHYLCSKDTRALTFRMFFLTRNSAADAGHFGAGTNAHKYSVYWLIYSKCSKVLYIGL